MAYCQDLDNILALNCREGRRCHAKFRDRVKIRIAFEWCTISLQIFGKEVISFNLTEKNDDMNKLHSFTFEPQKGGRGGGGGRVQHLMWSGPSPKSGLFYVTSKGGNIDFPPPSPPCKVCRCSSHLKKTTNTRTLNGGVRGGKRVLLFSEVTLFENNVSTILLPIVALPRWLLTRYYMKRTSPKPPFFV